MIKPTSVYVYLLVILVCNHSSNAAQCRSACKCVDEKIAELKGNLGYVGCFTDNGNRHFDTLKLRSIDMTLNMCREQCRGYIYVGLENGNECFCGNQLDVINYPPKLDAECNRDCFGDPNRKCGGPWRSSIYTVNI
ncbi:sialate:O-sulfotransferase 2-like isoform X2 [Mytilus galloprovincialis]|uniref:sialate:O-sulfotransferase 2-like isoform X1 n=1 Tax=Mytilus galloprovincialis TaxID=29158 RepID=UPI003F7B85BC